MATVASNPAKAGLHSHPRRQRVNALKDIVEPEDEVRSAAAAERRLDTEEHAVGAPKAEAEAVVGLEIAEIQILDARRDLAGVVEDRAVNGREDLPAVFGLQQQRVLIAEAETVKAAEIVRSTEGPLIVDRKSTRLNSSHGYISYAVYIDLHSFPTDALPICRTRDRGDSDPRRATRPCRCRRRSRRQRP